MTGVTRFFVRVDKVLRRSLGVAEDAPTDTTVVPAPPVDPTIPEDHEGVDGAPLIFQDGLPDDLAANFSLTMEDVRRLRKNKPVEAIHEPVEVVQDEPVEVVHDKPVEVVQDEPVEVHDEL
jgi:hypothetical protein